MKRALLVLAACGSGSEADPCLTKLAPLNQAGAAAACTGVDAVSRAFRACVIAAVDTPGVAACLEPLRDAQKPPPPKDAGAIDAAPAPPLDPSTLPRIAVPSDASPGEPVELYAIDAPTGQVLVNVAERWFLAPATTGKLTGHLVAPSRAAATVALGATVEPPPRGRGATVDLQFAGAPQHDLFILLGDVLRTNVVVAGTLPPVDILARRVPGDAVLAALAKLDGRTIVRHGNVSYLVPDGATLDPLPRLSGSARVTLRVRDGTATDAMAALRAVAPLPLGACGTQKLTLSLHDVKLPEAARAIAVAAGVPLDPSDRCPLADEPTGTGSAARTVAVAKAGGKTASVIARSTGSTIVHDDRSFPTTAAQPPPAALADWLASLARTSAVIRAGTRWSALFETTSGDTTSSFATELYRFELTMPPQFEPRGVTFNGVLVPLRKL